MTDDCTPYQVSYSSVHVRTGQPLRIFIQARDRHGNARWSGGDTLRVLLLRKGGHSHVATNGAGAGSFSLRMGDHKDDQHDALADRNASTLPSATSPSATSRSASPTWMARRAQCYAERVSEATERDAQTIFALSTSSAAAGELAALAAATSAAASAAAAEAADERAAIVAAERELSMFQPLMTADDR